MKGGFTLKSSNNIKQIPFIIYNLVWAGITAQWHFYKFILVRPLRKLKQTGEQYLKSSVLRSVGVAGDAALRCGTNGLKVVCGAEADGKIPEGCGGAGGGSVFCMNGFGNGVDCPLNEWYNGWNKNGLRLTAAAAACSRCCSANAADVRCALAAASAAMNSAMI